MEWDPNQPPRQPGADDVYYPPNGGTSYAPGYPGGPPGPPGPPTRSMRSGGAPRWRAPNINWAARNPLDPYIEAFQRRWETNRQFRATASAIIALTATVLLCACVTLATTLTTNALARANPGGPNSSQNTGTNAYNNPTAFPTNTIAPWAPPVIPAASPIPNSKTPQPSPSAQPSVSPTATSPGGGGPPVTTCNGAQQGVVWALTPCPQLAGQGGTLTIQARAYKNRGVNIILSFGCTGSGCTLDYQPTNTFLDGNGALTLNYTVPSAAANSQVDITGFIQPTGGPQVSILAAPVQ